MLPWRYGRGSCRVQLGVGDCGRPFSTHSRFHFDHLIHPTKPNYSSCQFPLKKASVTNFCSKIMLCCSVVSAVLPGADMATLTAAAAISYSCCTRSWVPSYFGSCKQSRAVLVGANQLCCRTDKPYLSMKVVSRIDRGVGGEKLSTIAQASSAVTGETENASDDSLEAAVKAIEFTGVHHVGFLCENVEKSLDFYCGLLGLEINPNRPNDKLPYEGVWLNVGSPHQMIHLMELPNPDPKEGRPKHGGRDRHACVSVKDVMKIKEVFDKAGVPYTFSQSGRPALFARDPDSNALEFSQL